MKFKLDENMPEAAVAVLCGLGHDASSVALQNLSGTADTVLSQICRAEGRALITLDLGFADVRDFPPADYPGIVVLRLSRQGKFEILELLDWLGPRFDSRLLAGRLWVVEPYAIRVRSI